MARIARVIAAGYPHHVTQRGNRRQQTFFNDEDYAVYLELLSEWTRKHNVAVWAYCLMPNHVHLIAVPETQDGLARAIGEAHRRYTRRINFREGWRGHLWQERFASFPMDEKHLLAAVRYVEMNPVAAGLVDDPEKYRWSSARAHVEGKEDRLVEIAPLIELVGNWRDYLRLSDESEIQSLHLHEKTGRPLGGATFIKTLENQLERLLSPQKRGPKKQGNA
ncbi:MAG TPA: transposase [Syntrophales bacterium]|jgi:putative transposase|nr:transposase [Syntrophales bacterium]HQA83360.1 transposase [Syntrophales bacterium]